MKAKKTLILTDALIMKLVRVYLVGELVEGGRSTLEILEDNLKGTFKTTVKRVLRPHARVDRSKPQTDYWFTLFGKDYTVYDLPQKIEQENEKA